MTDNPRETFFTLLAQLKALRETWFARATELQAAHENEVIQAALALPPTGKKKAAKALTAATAAKLLEPEAFQAITDKAWASYKAERDAHDVQVADHENRLTALAKDTPFTEGTWAWQVYHTASEYTYATQPDHMGYARREAQQVEIETQRHGLQTRVTYVQPPVLESGKRGTFGHFTVEVLTADAHDVDLLKYKPKRTLRDWLKLCLQCGRNRSLEPR